MSIASEINRINGEVSSQSTIIDEISTILDSKSALGLNSIDYSSNVYNTTSVSYYNKDGTKIEKEVGDLGEFSVSDVDFTEIITFKGNNLNDIQIKVVGGVMLVNIVDAGGMVTP